MKVRKRERRAWEKKIDKWFFGVFVFICITSLFIKRPGKYMFDVFPTPLASVVTFAFFAFIIIVLLRIVGKVDWLIKLVYYFSSYTKFDLFFSALGIGWLYFYFFIDATLPELTKSLPLSIVFLFFCLMMVSSISMYFWAFGKSIQLVQWLKKEKEDDGNN